MSRKPSHLLIRNAAELVTVAGPDRARSGIEQSVLEIIPDGAVLCEGERIVDVGSTRDVLRRNRSAVRTAQIVDADGHSVNYFDARDVRAAFDRGAVLFDGSDGSNYMVHASRRERPGMAEVHARIQRLVTHLGNQAG